MMYEIVIAKADIPSLPLHDRDSYKLPDAGQDTPGGTPRGAPNRFP